jgi:alpha-N-acetylglucosamine transferase
VPNPFLSELQSDTENQRWRDTYTKLRTWDIPFQKVVFIDADAVVIKNIDELFEYGEYSAAPECCDRFNSGVFVARPSKRTYRDMMSKINQLPSYDNADQVCNTIVYIVTF